jgi:WD40 repeat protein
MVFSVGFNPTNPSQLVSGSGDKTIRLWDVDSGKELKKLEGQVTAFCEKLRFPPGHRGRGVDDQYIM